MPDAGAGLQGRRPGWCLAALMVVAVGAGTPRQSAAQTPQNPSPMVEHTRGHERLAPHALDGQTHTVAGPAGRDVAVFVPGHLRAADPVDVVVHFHGADWLVQQAVAALPANAVAVAVNLGAGSGGYERAFVDPAAFDSLLAGVLRAASAATGVPLHQGTVTLVGFSAGYGAVRAILRVPRHFATVTRVLLLDGLHTSYVPEGTPVAVGGALDTTNLTVFADFARRARQGEKRFLVTHSEIFPGTFASTTETTDWLLGALGLSRSPVLRWGPRGMQQLSEVRAGGFAVRGFAGNTAPDHIDHLHALPELLGAVFE